MTSYQGLQRDILYHRETENRHCICTFGIPKKIIVDQGAEFAGNLFIDFCKQYNITRNVTSFQQSSSNFTVERFHSSLAEIYRLIFDKRKKENLPCVHEEMLWEALKTYNSFRNQIYTIRTNVCLYIYIIIYNISAK